MPAKFGTSGLRGLVEELSHGVAAVHVRAFLVHLLAKGAIARGDRVHVGQDLRPSSPEIAAHCMAAIEDEGFAPVDCGAVPTPALALYAMDQGCASVMVTGSHIPADRNGVKFYRPDGEIDKSDEAAITALASEIDPAAQRFAPHHVPENANREVTGLYHARYRGLLPADALSGLRLGLYEHSSVGRDILSGILARTGAEIVPLGRSGVFVPVDTEAVSDQTREKIRVWTRRHRLDALVSADGDADRPLLADETGECIRGDVLGLLTARYLSADAVVTPVTANSGLENSLAARIIRTRVGSPFVIAGMADAAAAGHRRIIGFEANGGVLTASPFTVGDCRLAALPTRDCVLPVLAALAAARSAGQPLSRLVAALGLPAAASGLIRDFPASRAKALVGGLSEDAGARAAFLQPVGIQASLDLTDGLRIGLSGGAVLHLRPSGNAPELRVYAEAPSAGQAEALVAAAVARILSWPDD